MATPIRWFLRRSFLLGFACVSLLFGCGTEEHGEVMVVVTTDMAVPTDFDTLVWSVTLSGESKPFQTGSVELKSGEELPATLAIVAGVHTTAPVTVRVAGRKGGDARTDRVSREVRLVIPNDRVAALDMPLTWLCSDANLSVPCPDGQTCEAGACVDVRAPQAEALLDYSPQNASECLDVPQCFGAGPLPTTLPSLDPQTGACTISGSAFLGDTTNLNIALSVNLAQVGSYGFCLDGRGACLIPLARDAGPNGWQIVSTSDVPVVQLPPAVCHDIDQGTIVSIVLSAKPLSCPTTVAGMPLCAPPADACLEAGVCPADWPTTSWQGYACGGTQNPTQTVPDLKYCFQPTIASDANGRYCCTKGAPPSTDPLLIDDMAGGSIVKLTPPEGLSAGTWWTSLGDGAGALFPAPGTLFTYRAFSPPEAPAGGPEIRHAACLSSTGFRSWVALDGFNFVQPPDASGVSTWTPAPFDVSKYTGISFWARTSGSDPLSVEVQLFNVDTYSQLATSTCVKEGDVHRCDNFFHAVMLGNEWTKYDIMWDELAQHSDGLLWDEPQIQFPTFDEHVYSTAFVVNGQSPDDEPLSPAFDFCIADIRFTE